MTSTKTRLARAPVVSLLSQGIGLLQLALMLLRVGANDATDTYLYLFNLGIMPIFGLLVGVMYPSLLNQRRLSRRVLARMRWATPCLSVAFVIGGCVWLAVNGRLTAELLPLAVLCGANTVVQARLWFRAVAAEAGGNPLWTASIALPANLLAVGMLLVSWPSPEMTVTAMVGGLVVGNVGLLTFMARREVGADLVASAPTRSDAPKESSWFLTMASVAFLGQLLLQSLAVLLPPSSVTLLNVAYKLVSAVSSTFVGAVLPMIVHQGTDSAARAKTYLRGVVTVVGAVALAGAMVVAGVKPGLAGTALIVAAWVVASVASAAAERMSYRFLPPVAAARTISVLVVVGILALASAQASTFSLNTMLCVYAVVDAGNAVALLWPPRDRVVSAVLLVALLGTGVIWVVSLL